MTRLLPVVLITTYLLGGCGVSGNKIDPAVAQGIKAGDTRSYVEMKLGEPDFADSPDENGICQVHYVNAESHGDVLSWVPYVNLFAGGNKTRMQTFRITYRNGTVQKCKLDDDTMQTSGGYFNMHIRKKPTPGVNSPAPSSQPK